VSLPIWPLLGIRDRELSDPQSGLTLLEVLIGLAITAGVAVVISASIRFSSPAPPSPRETLLTFIDEVSMEAKRSGEPKLLLIDPGRASSGTKAVAWEATELVLKSEPPASGPIRAVLFPDGTISSPTLILQSKGGTETLRLIYRPS